MMMLKEYAYLPAMVLFLLLFFSGCGVRDKALVLKPENAEAGITYEEETPLPAAESGMEEETKAAGAEEGAAAAFIYVHVCGAVKNPGVVKLEPGSRTEDALKAAGGFTEDAHKEYVNLASRLEDGQQLLFPTKEEAQSLIEEEKKAKLAAQNGTYTLVNINTASKELLCTLPGIGEARAEAIIGYRQQYGTFQNAEDIMKVPGIKQSAYEKISSRITVE